MDGLVSGLEPPPPPEDHKLYLVSSVALATVSFFLNSIHIVALVRHDLLTDVRHVLLLSQSIAGLLTTFTVVYPVKLVSGSHPSHWHDPSQPSSLSDLATCLTFGSGFYLLAVVLALTNSTLTTGERYLAAVHPRTHRLFREDYVTLTACISFAWIETAVFTLIPWLGWNRWRAASASASATSSSSPGCLLPDIWTSEFLVLLAMAIGAHLSSESLMLARLWLYRRRHAYAIKPADSEDVALRPVVTSFRRVRDRTTDVQHQEHQQQQQHQQQEHNNQDYKSTSIGLVTVSSLTTMFCHVPLFVHWMTYAGCSGARPAYGECPENDPQRTDAAIWTSLLLLVNAIVKPLLHVFGDDQLSKTSLEALKSCYS